ncbi:hypothetical protein ONZ45_g5720 [Pleurotus djamor]|nr:hypothetical protein ONZ45_g5720 [Pleurotus djamor]
MIPTPDLSHLTREDYERVYEPAEDTFLLLDALEQDAEELKALNLRLCLEIGSGSGCVSVFIGSVLGSSTALFLSTDINTHACACTLATGKKNKVDIEPVATHLDRALHSRLTGQVDLVVFNPPYVPTPTDEAQVAQDVGGIAGAWAGGRDGMTLTNVFLHLVPVAKLIFSPTLVNWTRRNCYHPKDVFTWLRSKKTTYHRYYPPWLRNMGYLGKWFSNVEQDASTSMFYDSLGVNKTYDQLMMTTENKWFRYKYSHGLEVQDEMRTKGQQDAKI